MNKTIFFVTILTLMGGCATTVRCGPGTLAVPDGVDPDGGGFFVNQDGDNYVDGQGNKYQNITCSPVNKVTICGTNTAESPPLAGDAVNPDGGGFFVNQDGGGFFVNQDGTVPAEKVCVAAEPA